MAKINETVKTRKNFSEDLDVAAIDMGTQFHQTKVRFREFTNYERPLTYEEWMMAPDECKAGDEIVVLADDVKICHAKGAEPDAA